MLLAAALTAMPPTANAAAAITATTAIFTVLAVFILFSLSRHRPPAPSAVAARGGIEGGRGAPGWSRPPPESPPNAIRIGGIAHH